MLTIPDTLTALVKRLAATEFLERHHAFHLIEAQAPGSESAKRAREDLAAARLLNDLVNPPKREAA